MKQEVWIHRRALLLFAAWGITAILAGHLPNGSFAQFLLHQISPMLCGAAMVGWQFEQYRWEQEKKLAALYRDLNALIDQEVVYQDEVETVLDQAMAEADFKLEPAPLPRSAARS